LISKIKERKFLIEKDVVRTDRHDSFFAAFPYRPEPPLIPLSDRGNGDVHEERVLAPNLEILRNVLLSYVCRQEL
jgi:hypothetical protein